jgi:DNA-binding GntR family transcriptional regulator
MKPIFKEEKRLTLVEKVANQLREAIKSGRLEPGDRLIETDIANAMKIGRNAVRESIRYLEKEGLITTTPFKGAHVTIPNVDEIDQMFEVMSGLEGMCARLAIEKMTDRDLKKIEALHADLEKHYAEKDPEAYLKTNWALHEFIQELTKNKVLHEVVNTLRHKILLYRQRQLYQPNRFEASIQEHRKILATFRKRDPRLAEKAMKKHLLRQGQALVKSYKAEDAEAASSDLKPSSDLKQ